MIQKNLHEASVSLRTDLSAYKRLMEQLLRRTRAELGINRGDIAVRPLKSEDLSKMKFEEPED